MLKARSTFLLGVCPARRACAGGDQTVSSTFLAEVFVGAAPRIENKRRRRATPGVSWRTKIVADRRLGAGLQHGIPAKAQVRNMSCRLVSGRPAHFGVFWPSLRERFPRKASAQMPVQMLRGLPGSRSGRAVYASGWEKMPSPLLGRARRKGARYSTFRRSCLAQARSCLLSGLCGGEVAALCRWL